MLSFEQVHKATSLGLSRFANSLPVLLRAGLLLLFAWYGIELFRSATVVGAKVFLIVLGSLFFITFLLVMAFTYWKYLKANNAPVPSSTTPLWPFLLINLLMILLVAAIGKWEQDRGLLGFTQHWVLKIGALLTGGSR